MGCYIWFIDGFLVLVVLFIAAILARVIAYFRIKVEELGDRHSFVVWKGWNVTLLQSSRGPAMPILASGFTAKKVGALKRAVQELAMKNPILTGRVIFSSENEIRIIPGYYTPFAHNFYHELLPPKHIDLTNILIMPTRERFKILEDHLVATLPANPSIRMEFDNRIPLFQFFYMVLPHDCLFYCMRVSHAIGDGTCYGMLLDQLSDLLLSEQEEHEMEMHPDIKWNVIDRYPRLNEMDQQHEVESIKRGVVSPIDILYKSIPNILVNRSFFKTVLLSQAKINAKKKQFLPTNAPYPLTDGDIIVSAIYDACPQHHIVAHAFDVRGRYGVDETAGGLLTRDQLFMRENGMDPNVIRHISKQNDMILLPEKIPHKNHLKQKVVRITDWLALKHLRLRGTRHLTSIVDPGTIKYSAVHNVVIFRMDADHLGLIHNVSSLDASRGLMSEILP